VGKTIAVADQFQARIDGVLFVQEHAVVPRCSNEGFIEVIGCTFCRRTLRAFFGGYRRRGICVFSPGRFLEITRFFHNCSLFEGRYHLPLIIEK
jgi:hypothetical protein